MADKFYVGQGSIFIASRDSSGQTSGFVAIGDADALSINPSQSSVELQESQSGNRVTASKVITGTDIAFSMNVKNIDGANLSRALYGTNTANAAGSVTDEAVTLYNGEMSTLAFPSVSSVVIKINAGVDTLVEDTYYTVDLANGSITILSGSTEVVAGTPEAATISYSHEANNIVEALTVGQLEYVILFQGVNGADDNKPVSVIIHRTATDMTSALDFIGTDFASLVITGKVLADENGDYVTVKQR